MPPLSPNLKDLPPSLMPQNQPSEEALKEEPRAMVRNTSKIERSFFFAGRQWKIGPFVTKPFPRSVARAFVEARAPFIVLAKNVTNKVGYQQEIQRIEAQYTWIANVTGNPDLPEREVERVNPYDGARETVMIPHSLSEPQVIKRRLSGGHVKTGAFDSQAGQAKVYEIYPFVRQAVPSDDAQTILTRESLSAQGKAGGPRVRRIRPPAEFEPDQTWDHDDIVLFAEIVDDTIPKMPRAMLKKEHTRLLKKSKGRGEHLVVDSFEVFSEDHKQEILDRLFFRLIDSNYPLPTREDFESIKRNLNRQESEGGELGVEAGARGSTDDNPADPPAQSQSQ